MAKSDIRIKEVKTSFSDEKFRTPLKLSSGNIYEVTYASIEVVVENRQQQVATGQGGILLSDLWAFPTASISHEQKDQMMRECVEKIADELLQLDDYYDPFQIAHLLESTLENLLVKIEQNHQLTVHIPKLAGLVCWSSFDAAVHDGWGLAYGKSSYDMYTAEHMNDDLSHYLGEGWSNRYPGEFLVPQRKELWIQHAVGASDLLTPQSDKVKYIADDEFPDALSEWIARDGVHWLKLKLKGADVEWDLQRILDVYQVAVETLKALEITEQVRFEVDPNEACPDPVPMIELLRKLRETDEAAYDALVYIEQPTPRNLSDYAYTLHEVSKYKPVLVDESLEDMDNLQHIERLGWNGVALKTCKGQSHALLTYCWAKQKNLFITVQDLTNPGLAFVHSANLASHLSLSCEALEYNSRQYIPDSRLEERKPFEEMFVVKNGKIQLEQLRNQGLY